MQSNDEHEYITQSLNGDPTAYGVLVDRYKNAIYHHCFAIVRDEDQAEDLAQETFITAFYKLHLYKPEYKLSTWLFKIATNKSLTAIKKNTRYVRVDETFIESVVSTQAEPNMAAHYSELHQAVSQLGPNYRTVVSLYYWQGFSYDEIATIMQSPVGSVKGWTHRAKQQLRKELS